MDCAADLLIRCALCEKHQAAALSLACAAGALSALDEARAALRGTPELDELEKDILRRLDPLLRAAEGAAVAPPATQRLTEQQQQRRGGSAAQQQQAAAPPAERAGGAADSLSEAAPFACAHCGASGAATTLKVRRRSSTSRRLALPWLLLLTWLQLNSRNPPSLLLNRGQLCSGCKSVRFCSIICQRAAWPAQRKACDAAAAAAVRQAARGGGVSGPVPGANYDGGGDKEVRMHPEMRSQALRSDALGSKP